MDIRARARRLKKSEGDLGLVVIDYLQLMTGRGRFENRQTEVADISRQLKILAPRARGAGDGVVGQLSRNLESRTDKTPQLSDLRESGSLEQDADVVMFIYRESEYNDEVPIDRADDALVEVAEHSNGPTGKANLLFLKQHAPALREPPERVGATSPRRRTRRTAVMTAAVMTARPPAQAARPSRIWRRLGLRRRRPGRLPRGLGP